jgi:hypothetical protein
MPRAFIIDFEGHRIQRGFITFNPELAMRGLIFLIALVFSVLLSIHGVAQADDGPLLKLGGLPYFGRNGYSGFSLHAEFEGAFKRTPFLTSGPRIDFISSLGDNYSLILAYDLKLYPLYRKSQGPYQGLFVGIEAGYFPRAGIDTHYGHGPGFGPLLGYQHIIKNKVSIAFEAGLPFLKELKMYHYSFANLKVGLKL